MSFLRNSIWFIKGLQEYTKGGFEKAAKSFNAADMENLNSSGRSYMVTGANSGIGKVVALDLAKAGGTVHLVCRNPDRGQAAVTDIKRESNNELVFLHVVDLSKPLDVYKFAKGFAEKGEPLDVLVNNAGCMVHERKVDELGFETNFATNTLAVHLLTETLLPVIKQSTDPRVITVSSGGMLTQKLNVADIQSEKPPHDGTFSYSQQKRQQVVMSEMYAARYSDVHFSSMHPGWADTAAVQEAMPSFYNQMKNKLRTAEQGADTVVWLALSPNVKSFASGKFFQDRKAVATHLPLSWTQSSDSDKQRLMTILDTMLEQVKQAAV